MTVALDAERLARIRRDPAIYDAVCAALAAAVATRPGESLFELAILADAQGLDGNAVPGPAPRP